MNICLRNRKIYWNAELAEAAVRLSSDDEQTRNEGQEGLKKVIEAQNTPERLRELEKTLTGMLPSLPEHRREGVKTSFYEAIHQYQP